MNLHQNLTRRNTEIANSIQIPNLGAGNVIPHWWCHQITSCGKPDFVAIMVLSELVYLHRARGGQEFNDGYTYLERKFNFTRSQLQAATSRLHELGIVTRSFRTIVVHGRNWVNELHLKLNIDVLVGLMPSDINQSGQTGGGGAPDVNFLSSGGEGEVFSAQVLDNSGMGSTKISKDHISNRNISIIKSRSSESSFCKQNLSEFADRFGRTLDDFHPLDSSDVRVLQAASGRDFDSNFVNQLLLRVADKHPNHKFPTKTAFMSYMSKLLHYEIRDAVVVSNGSFRFKDSSSSEVSKGVDKEKYLESVENTRDTSLAGQLRRKIAGVFGVNLAYELLSNSSFCVSGVESDEFDLISRRVLEMSDFQKERLLSEVKCVFGDGIRLINFKNPNVVRAHSLRTKAIDDRSIDQIVDNDLKPQENLDQMGVWGRVRQGLISVFGDSSDKNWFSKLDAKIDESNKAITLRAPSDFFKDRIDSNYRAVIEKLCLVQNFKLAQVVV